MVDGFYNRSVSNIDISDGHGNIVFDACVWDDECMQAVWWSCNSNVVELIGVIYKIIVIAFEVRMKRKMIRKHVNKTRTGRKFYI